MTTPHRRVRIVLDTCGPLWVITCETPCEPGGCQVAPNGRRLCWLGAGSSEAGAVKLAKQWGYEVVEP